MTEGEVEEANLVWSVLPEEKAFRRKLTALHKLGLSLDVSSGRHSHRTPLPSRPDSVISLLPGHGGLGHCHLTPRLLRSSLCSSFFLLLIGLNFTNVA